MYDHEKLRLNKNEIVVMDTDERRQAVFEQLITIPSIKHQTKTPIETYIKSKPKNTQNFWKYFVVNKSGELYFPIFATKNLDKVSVSEWLSRFPSTTSTKKGYLEGSKRSGLKVGDKVKVLRTAEHDERGWDNSWASEMNKDVGKVGIIRREDQGFGFNVKTSLNTGYNYPYFVLEKVSDKDPISESEDVHLPHGHGFIIGDKVKIVKAAKSHCKSWQDMWVPKMNEYVGKIGVIVNLEGGKGIRVVVGNDRDFLYPSYVLQKVDKGSSENPEDLIAEAKRRYPVGTTFQTANGKSITVSKQDFKYSINYGIHNERAIFLESDSIKEPTNGRWSVYLGGEWAPIVDHGDEKIYYIKWESLRKSCQSEMDLVNEPNIQKIEKHPMLEEIKLNKLNIKF